MSVTNDSPLEGTYADAALAYLAQGWNPVPVKAKFPPAEGATGRKGTVTPEKIAAWRKDPTWADQNIALRATDWIGIDVDAYGEKEGDKQLEELEQALGQLPVTISSTSRGQDSVSRTAFFQVPEGLEFLTKAAPEIDIIQHGHRYALVAPSWHPGTGEQYAWYDADNEPMFGFPSTDDMERLPEEWLEYLTVDPTNQPREGFAGSIEEWLAELPSGEPSGKVRHWIKSIPTDKFDHTDVVRITWNIVQLGAEGEPGIRQALDTLFETWVKPPYDTQEYRKELMVAIQGAVRKGGRILLTPAILPDYNDSFNLIKDAKFIDRWSGATDLDELARDAFSLIDSDRDVMSLVWKRAEALGKSEEDFPAFYKRIEEIRDEDHAEREIVEEASRYDLITIEERQLVAKMKGVWVERYLDYARDMVPDGYLNEPYHRAAAWASASMIFGEYGYYVTSGTLGLNLWWTNLGKSSTGKNQAMNPMLRLLDAYFGKSEPYQLGADTSSVGMHKKLINREGRPTLMVDDEISGPLRKWLNKEGVWGDMPDRLTSFYEGWARPLERAASDPETNVGTKVHLCTYFLSTPARFFETLSAEDFASGFMARMMWAIGEPPRKQRVKYKLPLSKVEVTSEGDSVFVRDWVDQIKAKRDVMLRGQKKIRMTLSDEAVKRLEEGNDLILYAFDGHQHEEMLSPSAKRMTDITLKSAGLLALADGRYKVSEEDVLYVLREAETWLRNVEYVASHASSSAFGAKLARILTRMREYNGTQVPDSMIHQWVDEPYSKVVELIRSLEAQGKIKTIKGEPIMYELTKKGKKE